MWPWVKIAVSRRRGDHDRTVSCTCWAWSTPLVSMATSPSSVSTTDELAKASTNATRGWTSAMVPLEEKGWCDRIGASPVKSLSASSRMSSATGRSLAEGRGALPPGMERVSIRRVTTAAEPESTLARSQAERRRRVLAATFDLAAGGGFDPGQMRDVAAPADVRPGPVFPHLPSKERMLVQGNAA